jgi:tRNA (mo5U34)-methyltransferase
MNDPQSLIASVPIWYHRFEIKPGIVTPGTHDPAFLWKKLRLPDDLSGKRALDIGASDGFFSLQMKRRGAQVVSIDYRAKDGHGFDVMEQVSGLDFEYHQVNFYNITSDRFGVFDIVLFLGVLYHLPDMVRSFSVLREVCTDAGTLFLETQCAIEFSPQRAAALYHRGNELRSDDVTNFWSPNVPCLEGMLHDGGFELQRAETWPNRYFAQCRPSPDPHQGYKLRLAYGTAA